ncbi:hypothetical protein C478_05089 [Natrinema thermotolerans DSM 11552]|nr:hypothetical protein C478_05089 [Natrinema thermotolerans DSM 11552]
MLVLGLLVAAGPVLALPFPGDGGPITFAMRALQVATALIGAGVAWTGYYSYRTGRLRPSVAVGATVLGWMFVGVAGGLIETATAFFVPIWVWVVGALAVAGVSVLLAYSDAVTPS